MFQKILNVIVEEFWVFLTEQNCREADAICVKLRDFATEGVLQASVKSDLSDLKSQQEELRLLKDRLRKEIGDRVEKIINECERLIKSADKQADTSEIVSLFL